VLHQLLHEDLMEDSVESLIELQVDNLYSSTQPVITLQRFIRLSDRTDISFHRLCPRPLCISWGLALGGP